MSRSGCQRGRGTVATGCSFSAVLEHCPGKKKKKEVGNAARSMSTAGCVAGANDIIEIPVWTD